MLHIESNDRPNAKITKCTEFATVSGVRIGAVSALVSCWTWCCGTSPCVVPKTAVLCGEHRSVRCRHSARLLHAARRPAVQHQPASLPPRRLFLHRAHARVFCFLGGIFYALFKYKGTLFYCQRFVVWRINGVHIANKPVESNDSAAHLCK